jgi:hypothetical protein
MGHPHRVDPLELEIRAKTVVRRSPVPWSERDGVWEAVIGRWAARVAPAIDGKAGWEWRAFSGAGGIDVEAPLRALGARGFAELEQAQQDAELTLAQQ